jgi:hypothetical protein
MLLPKSIKYIHSMAALLFKPQTRQLLCSFVFYLYSENKDKIFFFKKIIVEANNKNKNV